MIFVSLGTHQQGFPRALQIVSGMTLDEEIIAQIGETPEADAPGLTCVPYMEYEQIRAHMRTASCVICHAGVGTVLTALELGHTPVVIPRLQARGEHVDDHQLQLSMKLGSQGLIMCYAEGDSLTELVEVAQTRRGPTHRGDDALSREIARDVAATRARPARGGLLSSALGRGASMRPLSRR